MDTGNDSAESDASTMTDEARKDIFEVLGSFTFTNIIAKQFFNLVKFSGISKLYEYEALHDHK